MTKAEREELEACLKRASEILYNNTDTDSLETLAELEIAVRKQVLEHVSPKIAFFLSQKRLLLNEEKPERLKAVSEN